MRNFAAITVACFLALAGAPSARQTDALQAAADVLGAAKLRTLQFTGWGAYFYVGQSFTPNDPWPRVNVKNYMALINYDTASMRVEMLSEQGAVMPLGDGTHFASTQRQIQVVSGNDAWNVLAPPPGGGPPQPQPQPTAAVERMLALWATPHGFVKAAMANDATTRTVRGGTEVSFTVGGKYKMIGIVNSQNQVERVRTWIAEPLVGDMLVETVYRVYRDFDGVLFPSNIVQRQAGFPTLDLDVESVQTNPAVDITVPENVRGAQPPPVRVDPEKLAEGVYYLKGSHASLAVEMKDHIVLVDMPNDEARGLAVIARAKELIPNKTVRFVINTHHHWDHSGGIRVAIDEGATIVLHEIDRPFFERVATMPHTLMPDGLSRSKKAPKFQTLSDKWQWTDGTRTIEAYWISGNVHAAGQVMVYLPQEKILFEADVFNAPNPPNAPLLPTQVPRAIMFYNNIQRRKLDVQTIVPAHGGRTTTVAELLKSLGRSWVGAFFLVSS